MTLLVIIATSIILLTSAAASQADESATAKSWAKAALLREAVPGSVTTALSTEIPFSFVYDGKPSSDILPSWKRTVSKNHGANGVQSSTITYADPKTGLEVICEAKVFANSPAVEWVLHFTNTGALDTPIIEDIRPLDLKIDAPSDGDITLYHSHGSTCTDTDFVPLDENVPPNKEIMLCPNGGRSSDGNLPFFNLAWHGGGIVGAIGWSGQWEMRLHRGEDHQLSLRAGQQLTHLRLHPSETIRTPRMLLVMWQGDDRMRGHNLLRQLLIDHYVPRHNGEPVTPPLAQLTWFTFNAGNEVTQKNQFEAMKVMTKAGVECYWLDAGWFEGGWPGGAGSWVPKQEAFPNGLKPVGDEAHRLGMKFVLWFEPERVTHISRIAKDHPQWVMSTDGGDWTSHKTEWDGLYNLGDPAARGWLTDFLSKCIEEWGIDVYRNDFNIAPLPFWQAADAPDRQGISEIRYIEGLYAMWDDLLRRHPGLAIDNCASGGRRIDLETMSRSYPLWRSDTQCGVNASQVWDQAQSAGLSLYVPLHSAGVWGFDPYTFRSVATTGTNICPDHRAKDYDVKQLKADIEEMKSLRPFYLGDFYPLTGINTDETHWIAWQYERADSGFAMFFRRKASPYSNIEVKLQGLDPNAIYDVQYVDSGEKRTMSGAELADLHVELASAPSSLLVKFAKRK